MWWWWFESMTNIKQFRLLLFYINGKQNFKYRMMMMIK